MTRINCVPVQELCRQHLVAEYRELPRVFSLAAKANGNNKGAPKEYTLGTGHVKFFYNKCKWLAIRHKQLVEEMKSRGYTVNIIDPHKKWETLIHDDFWNNWKPLEKDIEINRNRIKDRMPKCKL